MRIEAKLSLQVLRHNQPKQTMLLCWGMTHGERTAERQFAEQDNKVQAFPRRFLEDSWLESSRLLSQGERSAVYRYFEESRNIPGFGEVLFSLDIQRYLPTEDRAKARPDTLMFTYSVPSDVPGQNRCITQMHFAAVNGRNFHLVHRYVDPEFRRRAGLGTSLYELAEEWLQKIAIELHHPVAIHLETGQRSVMLWAQKRGFQALSEQRDLFDLITKGRWQDEFEEDEAIDGHGSQGSPIVRDDYLFRKNHPGRHFKEDAIRVDLRKFLFN